MERISIDQVCLLNNWEGKDLEERDWPKGDRSRLGDRGTKGQYPGTLSLLVEILI